MERQGRFFFFLLPYQGFPCCFGWWTWSLVETKNITCTHAETETESQSLRLRAGQCAFKLVWHSIFYILFLVANDFFFRMRQHVFLNNHLWNCDDELIGGGGNFTTLTDSDSRFWGLQICSLVWKCREKRRCEWRNWHESISVPWSQEKNCRKSWHMWCSSLSGVIQKTHGISQERYRGKQAQGLSLSPHWGSPFSPVFLKLELLCLTFLCQLGWWTLLQSVQLEFFFFCVFHRCVLPCFSHVSDSYFFLDLLVVSIDVAILCVEFFGEAGTPPAIGSDMNDENLGWTGHTICLWFN